MAGVRPKTPFDIRLTTWLRSDLPWPRTPTRVACPWLRIRRVVDPTEEPRRHFRGCNITVMNCELNGNLWKLWSEELNFPRLVNEFQLIEG